MSHAKTIKIVTVYNSLNYGSYLQAFLLMKSFEQYENVTSVSFLNTNTRFPFRLFLKKIYFATKTFDWRRLVFEMKLYFAFMNDFKEFKISHETNENDIIVLGSDEIWNLRKPDFFAYPVFWGVGVKFSQLVSYATSCNVTTIDEVVNAQYPCEIITEFDAISVRDKHTMSIIEKISKSEVQQVLDPTLLYDKECYPIEVSDSKFSNYLLIYAYPGHFDSTEIDVIRTFARKNSKTIISVGFFHEWCDINLPVSPKEFLSIVNDADFIVTGSFHGTIFSVLFGKKFISVANDSVKIPDILGKVGLKNRYVKKLELDGVKVLALDYDIISVQSKINTMRSSSCQFIDEIVK